MLHLAAGVPLGVDVRDLLQLERALERHGEVDAPAQIQRVAGLGVTLRECPDLRLHLEGPRHEVRQARD